MILHARDLTTTQVEADLCIVGGGVAGLTLAADLADTSFQIVVLEAGGRHQTAASQEFYKGEVSGPGHPLPEHYRIRALGGSSLAWGGGCVPLDPIDFADRPWTEATGWPISYDELARFYGRALHTAEAEAVVPSPLSPIAGGLDGGDFQTIIERFSRPSHFGRRWGEVLKRAQNVRVLLQASATEIKLTPDHGAVRHIEASGPDGRRFAVRARTYVLAAGGLETSRLLLASRQDRPAGVGNTHGWLGRGYMCHIASIAGEVTFDPKARPIAHCHERDAQGIFFRRRLALTEAAQRRLGLLNLAFRLQRQDGSDPSHGDAVLSAIHLYKSVTQDSYTRNYRQASGGGQLASHMLNVVRGPGRLARVVTPFIRDRYLGSRPPPAMALPSLNDRYALEFHGEQAVNWDSRLALAEICDGLGMPRLRIDWRAKPIDHETVKQAYRLLERQLARTGAGRLQYSEELLDDQIRGSGAYGGHHIGATRMSARPEDGVVNANCRVHDLQNLYVASASVMPTSGQANPTLTILAITHRLADHMRDRVLV